MDSIAFFITPHGFGHAARGAAVMAALEEISDSFRFEIFTTTPRWFFEGSLSRPFGFHEVVTDIGFVQASPFAEDIRKTLENLKSFYPPSPLLLEGLAEKILSLGCGMVVCDISPIGIAVAEKAKVASVLVENFTWDWIYRAYADLEPRIVFYVEYLKDLFGSADHRVQTRPLCLTDPAAQLLVGPVSRKARSNREKIRAALGIGESAKMALITTGGVPARYGFVRKLAGVRDVHFVVPGGGPRFEVVDNVTFLAQKSPFYHPDLVNASDAVVGKAGYSTIAETYIAGVPFGYISRRMFPESPVLADFIEKNMTCAAIGEKQFFEGDWIDRLFELLSTGGRITGRRNGADAVARYIAGLMDR